MKSLILALDAFYKFAQQEATLPNPAKAEMTGAEFDKLPANEKIEFMKSNGKDMSSKYPGKTFLYDFPGKTGSTCLIGGRIVQFAARLIPVEYQKKTDMKTDVDSAVKYIVQWLKSNTDAGTNPALLATMASNLMGQKGAESSTANYNFAGIQITQTQQLTPHWKGHVFIVDDYGTKNGKDVHYVWTYAAMETFEDGIYFWLDFLKQRGFIDLAKNDAQQFAAGLQKKQYYNLPKKQEDGKWVVDEERAKKVRDEYYAGMLRLTSRPDVQAAIKKYVGI